MVSELLADELRDLKLSEHRQVFIDDTGDLAVTEGVETVEQSIGIRVSELVRPLIGETFTESRFREVASDIAETVQSDVQIQNVQRVQLDTIDEEAGVIEMTIFTEFNNEYEIAAPINNAT